MDSTNNYAMGQAHAGLASHGFVVFAHDQFAGKGQRGKTWVSTPGENIAMSTVLRTDNLLITQQFALSAAVALACLDLFSSYAGSDDTSIKWPNDIYWRDRKAGGILIENSFKGDRWTFAIAGTGININQTAFPDTARNPVSLRQITGRAFPAPTLARELAGFLDTRYEALLREGAPATIAAYNQHLFRKDQQVRLKKEGAVFETTIKLVTTTGELVTQDVLERRFTFGEVEWVI